MRAGRLVLVALLVAAAPAAAQDAARTMPAGVALARGDSLMAAFRTENALASYRQGLAVSSSHVELLWKAVFALTSLASETPGTVGDEERFQEAVELARRAVRAGPRSSRAHTALAVALGKHALFQGGRRKVALAREVYREAVLAAELDPRYFAPFVVLGVWQREVASLNPILRAVARTLLGGLPDASLARSAAYLERAVRLAPDYISPRLELGQTYLALEREEDARVHFEQALGLPPRDALDRRQLGEARELLNGLP